jgi:hypothetical protein
MKPLEPPDILYLQAAEGWCELHAFIEADAELDNFNASLRAHPKVLEVSDTDAWLRRLVVLSLKTPDHEQHFGKMAELILKNEASGILNWLLEGRSKLAKDRLQPTQTPEQKERAATLLLASDSPSAFVRARLVKKRDGELGVVDLYQHYQEWCRDNHLRSFPSKPFSRIAKEEIEITWGLKLRHDLPGENGKPRRGWKGLGLVGRIDVAEPGNGSCESGA